MISIYTHRTHTHTTRNKSPSILITPYKCSKYMENNNNNSPIIWKYTSQIPSVSWWLVRRLTRDSSIVQWDASQSVLNANSRGCQPENENKFSRIAFNVTTTSFNFTYSLNWIRWNQQHFECACCLCLSWITAYDDSSHKSAQK